MNDLELAQLLLDLALLFVLSYLLAGALARVRIPGVLAALFVAMVVQYTPAGQSLLSPAFHVPFSLLAQLGVMFLLFYIGLQIDLGELRRSSKDILWLTFLNTSVPFCLGTGVMLALGYEGVIAVVIGITMMPVAEAVIVPILDEFELVRTRVGGFIIGAGVLDDVIEVFLVAFVSVLIGKEAGDKLGNAYAILAGAGVFVVLAWACRRWLLEWLARWLPPHPRNLMLLSIVVLFGFSGLSQSVGLGMVVGAITAGILMRPTLEEKGPPGLQVTLSIQSGSYGFLGLIFFFWVGLHADVKGMVEEPMLAVLLFLAATGGKLIGVFAMVPMRRMTVREAWTVGIGLNARLTTEVIVAQLLYGAGVIDAHLFTALLAAASLSTLAVPVLFTVLLRRWGQELRSGPAHLPAHEELRAG